MAGGMLYSSMPMHIRFRTVGVSLFVFLMAFAACAADLGAKVAYKKDTPIQFPAFTLTYVGDRRVAPEKLPRGFLYYDFRVTSARGTQTVSWTSGTGDIGPVLFRVGNEGFTLELQISDKLGKLKENELVVNRAP